MRDRFVLDGLEKSLNLQYHCEVTEPFVLGLDHEWKDVIEVRRENYTDRETNKRTALIYWTKDGEPMIIKLTVNGITYRWDRTPATKGWSSYNYKPEV